MCREIADCVSKPEDDWCVNEEFNEDNSNIESEVEPSNVDEDTTKKSLLLENASPELISKNLAELKANKVSLKKNNALVLGAESVIDMNGELKSKPFDPHPLFKSFIGAAKNKT